MDSAGRPLRKRRFKLEAAVVIYLDDYRKAKSAPLNGNARYDDELMCVNWNPAVGAMAMSCYQTPQELSPRLPEDFSVVDIAVFMDRVYALASQI